MQKELLRNDNHHRCDSCGDPRSCKKYNLAYLCISCLRMDKQGIPRDNFGKIVKSSALELILNKPEDYNGKELRKSRKSRRRTDN